MDTSFTSSEFERIELFEYAKRHRAKGERMDLITGRFLVVKWHILK